MPIFSGAHTDSEEQEYPEPEGLAQFRARFTYDRQLKEFREAFRRQPDSDEELDQFFEEFTREMYNSGYDEIV